MTPQDDSAPAAPTECLACRGTGTLISGLGGEPHDVRCPWCEGTGTRVPGIDAQEHPAERAAGRAAAEAPAAQTQPDAADDPSAAA